MLISAEKFPRGMTAPTPQNTRSIWTVKTASAPLFNGITLHYLTLNTARTELGYLC